MSKPERTAARPRSSPRRTAHVAVAAVTGLLFMVGVAGAAWPFDPTANVPVCDTIGHQTQTVAVTDGAGGVIVAWVDTRHSGADVYAQRVTGSGDIAPGWPAEGRAVCVASGAQTVVRIASDGQGGAIVVWIDFRSGNADVYAQRVTGNSTIAAGWPANGRAVCTAAGSQANPAVVTDGAHGALIVWQDARSGLLDIYAQRVLASGVVDPLWPLDGRAISAAPADQFFPCIADLPGGGGIVAWQDTRSIDSDIFAQRIDAQGLPVWGSEDVPVCSATGTQEHPVIAADGQAGAFFCWTDYREAGRTRVYAQHLVANGSRAPFWEIGGNAISLGSDDQRDPFALADGGGGMLVAWVDTRLGSEDIFMVGLDGFGVPIGSWAEGGSAVCSAAGSQNSPRVALDGAGGVAVAWRDARNDNLYDIFGTRLSAGGTLAAGWIADGLPLGNAEGAQTSLTLVATGNGSAIGTWSDLRNFTHWDVYANRLGPDAILAAPEARGSVFAAPTVVPNPALGRATFWFRIVSPTDVELAVFDAGGRRIRTMDRGERSSGSHRVTWDGRDDGGRAVPAGAYFVRLKASGGESGAGFVIAR